MNKLQANGIKVPDDVIVTGFDNTFNARNSFPVLTTVKRPLFASGVKSCEVLYSLMRGEGQPRSTIMDAEPVYAESCGCQLKMMRTHWNSGKRLPLRSNVLIPAFIYLTG